ncbi:uncharacterized protein N7482_010610 [Penicillium canariense]|uniref:DUF7587 domain-containing protein n=1 Tax=Penicillium canariense TaxID=189055 RepID=A0A9W9LEG2_9EURO|nr:uncharacterized protein N7482_010610 [Penicillium canariense]KAJ5151358.1 hypothetical protein N7482_010610 [Penicillium canariense]
MPYPALNTQWDWMKRTKHPVWYHVHIDTDFRRDGEWGDIIHLIRFTAAQLDIDLPEKISDTITISEEEEFDIEDNPIEFMASVLLASPVSARGPDVVNSCAASPLVGSNAAKDQPSQGTYDTPSPPRTPSPRDGLGSPCSSLNCIEQSVPAVTSSPKFVVEIPVSPSVQPMIPSDLPSKALEQLVTSHDKVCLWCEREGKSAYGNVPMLEIEFSIDKVSDPSEHSCESLTRQSAPDGMRHRAVADVMGQDPIGQGNIRNIPGICEAADLPPLLYRWSNIDSQGVNSRSLFRAGSFADTNSPFFGPEDLSEERFLNFFTAHVTREHVLTPFISTCTGPLTPIHRALRKGEGAIVTIIDPLKLRTPVFKAQPLTQITKTTVHRWRGYGEFEIWGLVTTDAIIASFKITTLQEIASVDLEIQQFLQLPLIQLQKTSDLWLRRALLQNIGAYVEHQSVLERLAEQLGVPIEYCARVAVGIWESWSKPCGYGEYTRAPSHSPVPSGANKYSLRGAARSETESVVYVPPESDDGSCSESTEEEQDAMSQSPEAPYRRQDTPSSAYSVANDSDISTEVELPRARVPAVITDVAMPDAAVLPTPPSTSRYFIISTIPSPELPLRDYGRLKLSTSLDDDHLLQESDWPSDSEALTGTETPETSRYFDRDGNAKTLPHYLAPVSWESISASIAHRGRNTFSRGDF